MAVREFGILPSLMKKHMARYMRLGDEGRRQLALELEARTWGRPIKEPRANPLPAGLMRTKLANIRVGVPRGLAQSISRATGMPWQEWSRRYTLAGLLNEIPDRTAGRLISLLSNRSRR